MTRWWLSFCDLDKPPGQQFVGISIVEAKTITLAIAKSWVLGINPGGEIHFQELPDNAAEGIKDRALTAEEIAKFGRKKEHKT